MTIGIGAYGRNAGLAVFKAMKLVEQVAQGCIGGFASFAAINQQEQLFRACTQRGGSKTLFCDGINIFDEPPAEVAQAQIAGVITSGPDRPLPLSKFVAADPKVGIVTGHRSPHTLSLSGKPLNIEVLEAMTETQSPRLAVSSVLDANPYCDAGFIALGVDGQMYSANSKRVDTRPDVGMWSMESDDGESRVHVLHNAMTPMFSQRSMLGHLAAVVAMETMTGGSKPRGSLMLEEGCPVVVGSEDAIFCDDTLLINKVMTTDPTLVSGECEAAAIYLGAKVYKNNQLIGTAIFEPIMHIKDGMHLAANGQKRISIDYK